jgi:hypothetical protein
LSNEEVNVGATKVKPLEGAVRLISDLRWTERPVGPKLKSSVAGNGAVGENFGRFEKEQIGGNRRYCDVCGGLGYCLRG